MDDRVRRVVNYAEGPTILDFGAVQHDATAANGDNWLHGTLAERFPEVIGVDILTDDVHILQNQGYDVRVGDCTDLHLPVTADTVVAGEILEHVADAGGLLDSARRHLTDDGRLVLTTPNPWAVVHLRRLLTGHHDINGEHVAWHGPQTLRQLCRRHGFRVERLEATTRDHRGLTGLAQRLGSEVFGGTTWICVATVDT
jgi:2-polyprenyl-3-methyl-5-hydroxy-6-metoxy-1,4-benzoquinol methylase